jgi:hypothetical protein
MESIDCLKVLLSFNNSYLASIDSFVYCFLKLLSLLTCFEECLSAQQTADKWLFAIDINSNLSVEGVEWVRRTIITAVERLNRFWDFRGSSATTLRFFLFKYDWKNWHILRTLPEVLTKTLRHSKRVWKQSHLFWV